MPDFSSDTVTVGTAASPGEKAGSYMWGWCVDVASTY